MNTREVMNALATHYGQDSNDPRKREEWVLIWEARNAASFDGGRRNADLIAINTWTSRGLAIHGHEIKVSRQDWLKELKQPEKAQLFWEVCNYWWLVVPKPYAAIVKPEELPLGWGLKEVSERGVRQVTAASVNADRKQPSWSMLVAWFAGLDRAEKRDITEKLNAARADGRRQGREEAEADRLSRALDRREELIQEQLANIKAFEEALGISVHGWRGLTPTRIERIKALWGMTDHDGPHAAFDAVVRSMNTLSSAHQQLGTLADFLRSLGSTEDDMTPAIRPLVRNLVNDTNGDVVSPS